MKFYRYKISISFILILILIFSHAVMAIAAGTIETQNSQDKIYYAHTDHLTGSNVMTDKTGNIAQVLDYYPFGGIRLDKRTGTFNEQRKFIGQEYDEDTDLSYLNARYYDGARGQFISQDPVHLALADRKQAEEITGGSLEKLLADPQVLNSYSYARNNPIVNKDPEGKYLETAFDLAMFGLSLNDFRGKPSFWNGISVIADAASLVLPIPAIVGGIRHADNAAKFLKGADRVSDAAKGANKATDLSGISRQYNWGNPSLLESHTLRHAADFGLAKDNYAGYAKKGNEWISGAKNNFGNGIDSFSSVSTKKTYYYDAKNNILGIQNQNGSTASFYKPSPAGRVGGGANLTNLQYWEQLKKTGGGR